MGLSPYACVSTMPIYEYSCEKCGKIVELIQKVTDPAPRKHEGCGGRLSKVMSRSSFQLKGGGWYKDLYSSTPAKASESKSSSSDSKGGSKGGKDRAARRLAQGADTCRGSRRVCKLRYGKYRTYNENSS